MPTPATWFVLRAVPARPSCTSPVAARKRTKFSVFYESTDAGFWAYCPIFPAVHPRFSCTHDIASSASVRGSSFQR